MYTMNEVCICQRVLLIFAFVSVHNDKQNDGSFSLFNFFFLNYVKILGGKKGNVEYDT